MLKTLLIVTLLASAVIGVEILLVDTELWEAAPSHAYALIGFVALDVVIAALALVRLKRGAQAAVVWAPVRFLLMLGDVLTASSVGFQDYSEFANYLFTLWNFDTLLILQLLITAIAFKTLRTKGQ